MSKTGTTSFDCITCGYSFQHLGMDDIPPCPQCGAQRWLGSVVCPDEVTDCDELGVTGTNKEGKIAVERIQKTDPNTRANFAADLGEPSKISVDRKTGVAKDEEEGSGAEALVNSFNKRRGTSYNVKDPKDHIYHDRVFISENDIPNRIIVQTTNLDTVMIAEVGSKGLFDGDRTTADIIASVCNAISRKANVDLETKAKTILQLLIPSPIGVGIRQAIEENTFDCQGFKEIWISPFHEESFPLSPS